MQLIPDINNLKRKVTIIIAELEVRQLNMQHFNISRKRNALGMQSLCGVPVPQLVDITVLQDESTCDDVSRIYVYLFVKFKLQTLMSVPWELMTVWMVPPV